MIEFSKTSKKIIVKNLWLDFIESEFKAMWNANKAID